LISVLQVPEEARDGWNAALVNNLRKKLLSIATDALNKTPTTEKYTTHTCT
jgi:hypothetical protein